MSLGVVFLTGLTTGGLSCLAMQGGLLAGCLANQKKAEARDGAKRSGLRLVAFFLGAKLVAHIGLGFLLGWVGSVVTLSLGVRVGFQILTALFMLVTALNLLDVHPIFRYAAFTPPRWLRRPVARFSKNDGFFAPVLLGALTVFVPCGVTQAMEVLAINTANGIQGALILGFFVLGTLPLFTLIGLAVTRLGEAWNRRFRRVAAIGLAAMSVYVLNGALVVLDLPVHLPVAARPEVVGQPRQLSPEAAGPQKVTIEVVRNGYSPAYVQVKRGIPVELTLETKGVLTCASAFVFREFGITAHLMPTDTKTFRFTPTKVGTFPFTCSMGMYSGVLEVV